MTNEESNLKPCRLILLIGMLLLASIQALADEATIISDTALYQRPSLSSPQTAFLEAGTPVTIMSRAGGWKQVKTREEILAWVRSYRVRSGTIIVSEKEKESGGFFSGLASLSRKASGLFSSEKKAYSFQRTATIGVRGLSEEQIKAAKPNLKELSHMESFRSSRAKTEIYAREGQLKPVKIAHMPKSEVEK